MGPELHRLLPLYPECDHVQRGEQFNLPDYDRYPAGFVTRWKIKITPCFYIIYDKDHPTANNLGLSTNDVPVEEEDILPMVHRSTLVPPVEFRRQL
uniref:YTH domain-containing protein n=1 Tax=Haemonchus contortus TaxID=6289 RepID=A0A7I4XSS3_HAECO